MKKVIFTIGIFLLSVMSLSAQNKKKNVEQKIAVTKVPQKVKETLKCYSGYKINPQAIYAKTSDANVYKFVVTRKHWKHVLIIDETGKVRGIDDGEPNVANRR